MFRAPRGTQDILPSDQKYWQYVTTIAEKIAQLYGFRRIDTPTFEESALFHRGVGSGTDIVEKETYDFTDKGKGQLTLRPEGTASVCRAYIEHGLFNEPKPQKLYYLASLFRYDRPQKGRYRQHHQFGGEVFGDATPLCDAETIGMLIRFYQELGLRDLLLYINSIGCSQCRPPYLSTLKEYYEKKSSNICPDCQRRLGHNPLRLLDCKEKNCADLAQKAPHSTDFLCKACTEHFRAFKEYLSSINITFIENHRLVRGLDYYSRTVFEIVPIDQSGQQSSIGGGGRYDKLVSILEGPDTPAFGFGTGLERIIINLKEQGVEVPEIYRTDIFVAYAGSLSQIMALKISEDLRQQGIITHLGSADRSLKAQMKQADKSKACLAVIVGEDEAQNNQAVVKPLLGKEEQRIVRLSDVITTICEMLEKVKPPTSDNS